MNLQSGKFDSMRRGKLSTRASVHVAPQKIEKAVNSPRAELLELTIGELETLKMGEFNWDLICQSRKQVRNWSRSKFPVLKIETVENGSIRQ